MSNEANNFEQTSLEAALHNTILAVQSQVALFNAQLIADYKTKFGNWSINVVAGRIDNTNPPKPQASYVVAYVNGPPIAADNEGSYIPQWAYPQQVGGPVCAELPVPPSSLYKAPPVMAPHPSIRNVPVGDTLPVGFTMLDEAGSTWQKQSSPTPFGMAYFYAKIG